MNKVDPTQRSTGARWWLGPLGVLLVSFLEPLGGLVVGAFLTGYLILRKAPRRDVVAMAVVTSVVGVIFVMATMGYIDAYSDYRRVGSDAR